MTTAARIGLAISTALLASACASAPGPARPTSPLAPQRVTAGAEVACAHHGLDGSCADDAQEVAALLSDPAADNAVVLSSGAEGTVQLSLRSSAQTIRLRVQGNLRYEISRVEGAGPPRILQHGTIMAPSGGLGAVRTMEIGADPTDRPRVLTLRSAGLGDVARLGHLALEEAAHALARW